MNTDELEAGPQMDALVAEKVMGWSIRGELWKDKRGTIRRSKSTFEQYEPSIRWSPSTDIAAAWEVVEKMPMGMWPSVDGWVVEIPDGSGDEVEAPTAPLAICRAALKAIERG